MKKQFILFISLIICSFSCCCKKTPTGLFTIEGFIKNAEDSIPVEFYYLSFENNKWHKKVDSTKVKNGRFFFEGKIEGLTAAQLYFSNVTIRIYMEPTKMKLWIDENEPYAYTLSGTKVEKENSELRKNLEYYEKKRHTKLIDLLDAIKNFNLLNKDIPIRDSMEKRINNQITNLAINDKRIDSIRLDFVSRHCFYQIAPDLLYLLLERDAFDADTIKYYYNDIPVETKESLMGKLLSKKIEQEENKKKSLVGCIAPDFVRTASSGKQIVLENYRDRNYLLLDFWASWCIPCLKEMPKIKEIYGAYKDKGLEIIGVSLDGDRDEWLKTIDKYKLDEWPQILSKQHSEESIFDIVDLSDSYNFNAIPFYVLIDKDGKVLARWESLNDEQLSVLDNIIK